MWHRSSTEPALGESLGATDERRPVASDLDSRALGARMAATAEISALERIGLVALTAFYFLFALGTYGLLNDNEGLYAEIAREMASGASLIAPHLNGVPYLEKPPLLVWLVAALYRLFGPSEWASRAVPAASGIILVAGTFIFTGQVNGTFAAWIAALILGSSLASVVVMRTLMPDGLLVCLFSLSMYLFYLWHVQERRKVLVLSYATLGVAVLAKGFVVLALGGLAFVVFAATGPRTWRYADLLEPRALLAFLAVTMPWHVALAWHNFDFAWFYVYHEHVLRFLGLRRPQDYYTGPFYYYLPRIVVGLFPWSMFLPALLVKQRTPTAATRDELSRFLWVWFCVALVFFSVSRAKGNYYMLIGSPPLAILLAGRIATLLREGRWRLLAALSCAPAVVGALAMWLIASDAWLHHAHGSWTAAFKLRESLLWGVAAFTALAALAGLLLALRRPRIAFLTLGIASVPLLLLFALMMQRAGPYSSERTMACYLRARHPGEPVYLYHDFERLSSLPYYLGHTVPIVGSRSDDLLFGAPYAHAETFLSDARFAVLCRHERVVLLVHRLRLRGIALERNALGLVPVRKIGNVTAFECRPTGAARHAASRSPTEVPPSWRTRPSR